MAVHNGRCGIDGLEPSAAVKRQCRAVPILESVLFKLIMNYITKNNQSAIINFRVSPEVKQNLEKLAKELCTTKTKTLRFMIEYFNEMKTGEVLVRKHTLEVQNLRKRLRKQNAELDRITSRIEKGEKLAVDEVQSLA